VLLASAAVWAGLVGGWKKTAAIYPIPLRPDLCARISAFRHGGTESTKRKAGDKGRKNKGLWQNCGTRRKSQKKSGRFPFWSHGARANAVIGGRVGLLFEPQRHEEHKGG